MAQPPSTTTTAAAADIRCRNRNRRPSLHRLISLRPLRRLILLPNPFSFTSVLSSAARSGDLTAGEVAHCQSIKRGFFNSNTHICNCLIHLYAVCGVVTNARQVFDEMCHRDVISWNSMVDGYVKVGDLGCAREIFDEMPVRNVVSWNVMIGGYLKGRRTESGLRLFRKMMEGEKGDEKTMVEAVTGCGRLGRAKEGRSVHGRVVRGFEEGEGNVIWETALVDMYGKCGRIEDARRVFDGMNGRRNLVCWNAMVLGCCGHGMPKEGIALFEEMVQYGATSHISPDEVTFVGVLSACARGGLLEEGKKYFEQMTDVYHLKPTFAHYWCMANLYGSLDLIQEAIEVLKSLPEEKESLVWSGLLGYCRFRGDIELASRWKEAQQVKDTMMERGIRRIPNGRLVDLNEIVHDFKVGDRSQPEIEKIYSMMDDFAITLRLPDIAPE